MRVLLLATLLALAGYCHAQSSDTLLYFSWDDNPITESDIGPNATSNPVRPTSTPGGFRNNGLAATDNGTKENIDMFIENDPALNTAGMDISFAYNRLESDADILDRGDWFLLGTASALFVSFRLDNGDGTFEEITSGNYSFTQNSNFETARFRYDPNTGEAFLELNGSQVWTYTDPNARPLYWTGAPGFVIGRRMDGSGSQSPTLDELVIREVSLAGLPVELTHFAAHTEGSVVHLNWQTVYEEDNDYFAIERAAAGGPWREITRHDGRGTIKAITDYTAADPTPPAGMVLYRLRQVDYDGAYAYSEVRSVTVEHKAGVTLYPNPTVGDYVTLSVADVLPEQVSIYAGGGARVRSVPVNRTGSKQIGLDIGILPPGLYLVRAGAHTHRLMVR